MTHYCRAAFGVPFHPARGFCSALLALAGWGVLSSRAEAASLVLRPVADATLYESVTTNNLGASTTLIVGTTDKGERNRGLLKFDPAASLPVGAVVRSARLDLVLTADASGGAGTLGIRVHRLEASWGEGLGTGNRGSAVSPGEVTWTHRSYPGVTWSTPGAQAGTDYGSAPTASATIGGVGTWSWSEGLAVDVQSWLANPAGNHGWILVCDDDVPARTSRRFATREDSSRAPQLTVEYDLGETGVQLPIPTLFNNQFRLVLPLSAGHVHALEFRELWDAGSWQEATNYLAQPVDREVEFLTPVSAAARFFRLRTDP